MQQTAPLLLLDEPTVGVDPQSRHAIFENILALKKQGRTVIYTTHYMEEAEKLCDRVAIVDQAAPPPVSAPSPTLHGAIRIDPLPMKARSPTSVWCFVLPS